MNQLRQSLLDAPTIEKGDYEYSIHPTNDGIPMLEPGLLREIVIKVIRKANLKNVDKIITPATMDIHISTAVSLMTNTPPAVTHKHEYGLNDGASLHQQTGHPGGGMFINDVNEGGHALVLDDVLLTGGTMKVVPDALDHVGTDVVGIVAVIKKADLNGLDDSDHHAKTLISMTVEDDKVVIVDEHGDD